MIKVLEMWLRYKKCNQCTKVWPRYEKCDYDRRNVTSSEKKINSSWLTIRTLDYKNDDFVTTTRRSIILVLMDIPYYSLLSH